MLYSIELYKKEQTLDDDLTPTKRKQARLSANNATTNQPNGNESDTTLPEAKLTSKQLWHKWQTKLATPEMLADIERDRALLAEMQKINPKIGHAKAGITVPLTPEMLKDMQKEFEERYRPRKKGK